MYTGDPGQNKLASQRETEGTDAHAQVRSGGTPLATEGSENQQEVNRCYAKECDSLRGLGAWDASAVQEWSAVRDAAKGAGMRISVRMVFGICVENGSELPRVT